MSGIPHTRSPKRGDVLPNCVEPHIQMCQMSCFLSICHNFETLMTMIFNFFITILCSIYIFTWLISASILPASGFIFEVKLFKIFFSNLTFVRDERATKVTTTRRGKRESQTEIFYLSRNVKNWKWK